MVTEAHPINEEVLEINEYISGLFSINDSFIFSNNLSPQEKISTLSSLEKSIINKVTNQIESLNSNDNSEYFKTIKAYKKYYLLKILEQLLDTNIFELKEDTSDEVTILFVLNEIGFLDNLHFYRNRLTLKTKNIELNQGFLEHMSLHGVNLKRNKIITKLFNNNHDIYILTFKKKLKALSRKLFKQKLFLKAQELNNNELEDLLTLLLQDTNATYTGKNNISNELISCPFIKLYLSNGNKNFYHAFSVLISKLKNNLSNNLYTDDDKNLLSFYMWIKEDPKVRSKLISEIFEVKEREKLFSHLKPNYIYTHLLNLDKEVAKLTGENFKNLLTKEANEIFDSCNKNNFQKLHDLTITTKVETIEVIKRILSKEESFIRKLKLKKKIDILKKTSKKFLLLLLFLVTILVFKYTYNHFFEIESIYNHKYLKIAKVSMDVIPYPPELKDSQDPIKNETRQKQRLDYIRDLNNRYFKIITLFLAPNITIDEIQKALQEVSIPKELKSKSKIKKIRKILRNIISQYKWNNTLSIVIGSNLIEQLRAYGAITNYLTPPLLHHVIKDNNGLPVKINNKFQMFVPRDEMSTLKKEFISIYNKLPTNEDIEPRIFIKKHDLTYKQITNSINFLTDRIERRKKKLFKEIKTTNLLTKKQLLKDTLLVVAILETRIKDLDLRIKERYKYITSNNTYRLPVD